MRKIGVFDSVTVDGFYAGPNGELDWFKHDDELNEFSSEQAKSGDTLIFGRTTYEMMAGYWPTPDAMKTNPVVAGIMNSIPKIVFSKTLKAVREGPNWTNIRLLHEIRPEEIVKLKEQGGRGIAILGSGTIVQQFANLGLIDEYRLLVHPVVLGAGKPLFKNVKRMNLRLLDTRTFKSGIVLLTYKPV